MLEKTRGLKSMVSYHAMHKKIEYFENIGPNWSKIGSFVDRQILHVTDFIFG